MKKQKNGPLSKKRPLLRTAGAFLWNLIAADSRCSSRRSSRKVSRQGAFEYLENRQMFHRDEAAFVGIGSLTFSFAPDGTPIGRHESQLFQSMTSIGSAEQVQQAFARALQKWTPHANVNFGFVQDGGMAAGVFGPTRGDDRFGDIRVSGFDYSLDTFAEAVTEQSKSVGSWAGDVLFNTAVDWGSLADLESAALHEIGHVLGLEHSNDPNSPMYAHGPSPARTLTPEDINRLQLIHGSRKPDSHELSNNNDVIARASQIKGNIEDTTTADGFNGSQVWIQFGDLTTANDRDVYEIKIDPTYRGSVAVQVRSQGLSLARLKISITDRSGQTLSSGSVDGPLGGITTLEFQPSSVEGKYYLHVESGPDPFWSTGDYAITIASPTRLATNGKEISDFTDEAHRWYYDSDFAKDGFSWQLVANTTEQPDLDDERQSDDSFGSPRTLLPSLVTTSRTLYRHVGTVATLSDIDHWKVRSPKNGNGPLEMTVDIESLQIGGFVPEAEIVSKNGTPVTYETRVRSYGQYEIVLPNAAQDTEYIVRLKSIAPGAKEQKGNYSLTITFAAPSTRPTILVEEQLSASKMVVEREWYIARPQLFSLSLVGNSDSPMPNAQIWVTVFDEQKRVVAGLVAPMGQLRTSPGILLDPGTYYLQIAAADLNPIGNISFALTSIQPSQPIGPILGTIDVQPMFLCAGETALYCYPETTLTTPSTYYVGNTPSTILPSTSPAPVPVTPDLWFWQNDFLPTNPSDPLDTNGDFQVTPLDVLIVINQLNLVGIDRYPPLPQRVGYLDTNRDGQVSPLDALLVINRLNLTRP